MKTWTNPAVEELDVKLTARGFTDEGKEWNIWNPVDGDNPFTDEEEVPQDPPKVEDPEGEYTPS